MTPSLDNKGLGLTTHLNNYISQCNNPLTNSKNKHLRANFIANKKRRLYRDGSEHLVHSLLGRHLENIFKLLDSEENFQYVTFTKFETTT